MVCILLRSMVAPKVAVRVAIEICTVGAKKPAPFGLAGRHKRFALGAVPEPLQNLTPGSLKVLCSHLVPKKPMVHGDYTSSFHSSSFQRYERPEDQKDNVEMINNNTKIADGQKTAIYENATEMRIMQVEYKIDNVSMTLGSKIDLVDVKIIELFRHIDRMLALMGSLFSDRQLYFHRSIQTEINYSTDCFYSLV